MLTQTLAIAEDSFSIGSPIARLSSLKASLKFRLPLLPDYSSSDPQEVWQDPGRWQSLSNAVASTLPFWKVAKTSTRSTEIQKITNKNQRYLARGAGCGAEVPTFRQPRRNSEGPCGQSTRWRCHGPHLSLWLDVSHRFSSWKGKKELSLLFCTDYIHLCRASNQQQHDVVHICLGDLSFSFWLQRKHDSQMKGHFTRLAAHLRGNSNFYVEPLFQRENSQNQNVMLFEW